MNSQDPLNLTGAAYTQLHKTLIENASKGLRIRLRTRGCSGLSYIMEYVNNPGEEDLLIPLRDPYKDEKNTPTSCSEFFLAIHRGALMFLVGSELDYQTTPTRSGFVFRNPQEKGRCGCGSSFHV